MLAAPSVRLHLDLSRLQSRGCLGRVICGTPLDVCEAHTMSVMRSELEEAVDGWHRAARSGDLTCAAMAVGEPIVVLELKGAGPNVPGEFAGWVERSGIRPVPRSCMCCERAAIK